MGYLHCKIKDSDFFMWGMQDMKEILRLMVEWYVESAGVNKIIHVEPFFNPYTNRGIITYEMEDDKDFLIEDMNFYLNDNLYTMEFY
jgi:hypothetical protein